MKKFSFGLLALLTVSSVNALASENILRYYDPTVKGALQPNDEAGGSDGVGEEDVELSHIVPSSQKDYSIRYMYGCSLPYECIGFNDSIYMQNKSRTLGLTYELNNAVSMVGFEWNYNLPHPHINKFPRSVSISIYDGSSFVVVKEQPLSSTGGSVQRVVFANPLPPSTAIRFTFTGSQDGWGYTALQYFSPLAIN